MQLRLRIGEWLEDLFFIREINGFFGGAFRRADEYGSALLSAAQDNALDFILAVILLPFGFLPYVLFGKIILPNFGLGVNKEALARDWSIETARKIQEITRAPAIRELLEVVGALMAEPLFSILNSYAAQDNPNPDEFLRTFYGYLVSIPLVAGTVSTLGELASFGQIDNLGKPIADSQFTMGLGFMGWQGITPLLTEGVLVPLERQTKQRFRQTRYNTSQALELYQRNLIEYETLVQILRWEGWRDGDIPQIINLSYRSLSDSQLFSLFDKNLIGEDTLKKKLRDNGWKSQEVNLLLAERQADRIGESKSVGLASAKKAYKLRLISEAQFKDYLKALDYSTDAINLEISILNFEETVEQKSLSVSQLRQAYESNQITQNEALSGLTSLGYAQEDAQTLFDTWLASKSIRVLKVNQSTITNAMIRGVLTADEALAKLQESGYDLNDARLIIDTVNAKGGGKKRLPSVSQLLAAMQAGLLTKNETLNSLQAHGFDLGDSNLLIDLTLSQAIIQTDEDTILEAFLFGVFSESEARNKLAEIGASQDFIDTRIATMKRRSTSKRAAVGLAEYAKWYRHGLIDESGLLERAKNAGLSDEDSQLFLQSIGLGAPRSLSDSAIRDALFYEIITPNEGLTAFRQLGLSQNDAQIALDATLKRIEHQAPRASISSLLDAARKGIISLEQFEKKLQAFLLDEQDIMTYLALATYEVAAGETKLTKADILKAYRENELDRFTAITLLESKGYTIEEAELLIRMERKDITDSLTHRLLISGAISFEDALVAIQSEGFSDSEIADWINLLIGEGLA